MNAKELLGANVHEYWGLYFTWVRFNGWVPPHMAETWEAMPPWRAGKGFAVPYRKGRAIVIGFWRKREFDLEGELASFQLSPFSGEERSLLIERLGEIALNEGAESDWKVRRW